MHFNEVSQGRQANFEEVAFKGHLIRQWINNISVSLAFDEYLKRRHVEGKTLEHGNAGEHVHIKHPCS